MSRRYDDSRRSSSHRDSRRSSPGPSRGRSPSPRIRGDDELPTEFGRPMELTSKEDENTVLRRMKTAFQHGPLNTLNKCVGNNLKIKIWTRNFKEVRGICIGYVVAFDKHWNLILSDVEEVYLKPKKAKTPYLQDSETGNSLPELPPKVPREKKTRTPEELAALRAAEEAAAANPKKKKRGRKVCKRYLKQLFIRGDNIVMCAVLDEEEEEVEEEEEPAEANDNNSEN